MDDAVPDLYDLAFMPGCFRCPKCEFILSKACINSATGQLGTRPQERESEECPNDGTMMVHLTYREQVQVYSDRLKGELDRRDDLMKRADAYILALRQVVYSKRPDIVRLAQERLNDLGSAWSEIHTAWDGRVPPVDSID
jgi:hypothetical protein